MKTKKAKVARFFLPMFGIAILLSALPIIVAPPAAMGAPAELSILSGSPGGTWYPITAGIAEIFTKAGAKTNSEVGAGLANVARVSAGAAELGVTTSTVPPVAKEGKEPFKKPITNILGLAVLFPSYLHVGVTRSSAVTTIEGLKGLRVNCMAIGNSTEAAFADSLQAVGMSEDDLKCTRGSHNFASDAIKDGNLDGFALLSGYPNGTYTELFHAKSMRLLPLSKEEAMKMSALNPGYVFAEIPAGSYPGQDKAIPTVRSDLILFANETMSDDDAYWIVKTMLEKLDEMKKIHAAMRTLTPEYMASVSGLKLHPGALRAYKEAGIPVPSE